MATRGAPLVCPLCGGELRANAARAFDRLVTGDGPFTVSECSACSYGVTVPQLRGVELDRYYGGEYFGGFYDDGSLPADGLLERARGTFRRVAARRRFGRAPYAVFGLEPGRVLDVLREAVASLAPNGRLALALPNWRCWQRHLFGGRWFHLDLPRHLQHFSPHALQVAADVLGLEILEIGTSSTVISGAYSIHYLLAGRWTPGWKLWLAYAMGTVAFPPIALINRLAGADCCYALLAAPAATSAGSRL
jgi:hypothetical protein